MADDHHCPDKDETEGRNRSNHDEYCFWHDIVEDNGDEQDCCRKDGRLVRDAGACEVTHGPRGMTSLGKGVNHTACGENSWIGSRGSGGQDNKVDDGSRCGNPYSRENGYKWTLSGVYRSPRVNGHDDGQSAHIEDNNANRDIINGHRNDLFRIFCFPSGEAHQFDTGKGEYNHLEGEDKAPYAIREPAPVIPKIGEWRRTCIGREACHNHDAAYDDEGEDGDDLNEGKPEF